MRSRRNKFKPKDQNKPDIRLQGILPAPGILESYEEISPGSVQKILAHIRVEQEHRHKLDNNYLKIISNTFRMGQLLAFVLAVVILYACIFLFTKEHYIIGSLVLIVGFAFNALFLLCYQSTATERMITKKNNHKNKDPILM